MARADPQEPSGWAGRPVAALDRHLGAVVATLAARLLRPDAPHGPPGPWVDALADLHRLPDEPEARGPGLAAALPELHRALAAEELRPGGSLADSLLPALVELVAHGSDLPDPVDADRSALRPVVKALATLLAGRAPGRHVEARIPPYAAVQCVEGPRHTRGTPPNVVEAEPTAFVALCTGRLAWADAVRDGRVRTWGDRADLSPWLPLWPVPGPAAREV